MFYKGPHSERVVLHALGTGSSGRRRDDSQPGTPPGPDQDPPSAGDAWEPVITRPDPMTEEERQAWLDALDEPFDPGKPNAVTNSGRRMR